MGILGKQPDNGPPQGVGAMDLRSYLMERPWPSEVVESPIKTYRGQQLQRFRIRVLYKEELINARVAALKWVLKKCEVEKFDEGNPVMRDLLEDGSGMEALAMALVTECQVGETVTQGRTVPVYGRIFLGCEDVRRMLTDDEIVVLWNQYLCVQRKLGPLISMLTGDEVNAWVERLGEAASTNPLAALTLPALQDLCLSLALMLWSGSSPPASPSDSSPSTSESSETPSLTGTSSSGEGPAPSGQSTEVEGASPGEAVFMAPLVIAPT